MRLQGISLLQYFLENVFIFFFKKNAVMFYWRAAVRSPFLGNMKGAKITILLAALKHFSYENNFVGLFTKNSFFSLAAFSSFQAFSFEISSPKTDFNCTVIKNHEFNYTKFEAAFLCVVASPNVSLILPDDPRSPHSSKRTWVEKISKNELVRVCFQKQQLRFVISPFQRPSRGWKDCKETFFQL